MDNGGIQVSIRLLGVGLPPGGHTLRVPSGATAAHALEILARREGMPSLGYLKSGTLMIGSLSVQENAHLEDGDELLVLKTLEGG